MPVIERLGPATEFLYELALELDNVPVSVRRLLWLQEIIRRSYVQNDDGDWLHYSGAQLWARDREWTTGLPQGDVNTLVELIRRRSDPGYFLLDPASMSEGEEILDAKILSFDHTDPATQKRRQEIAAERGVPYVPPVGEGVIDTDGKIQQNLSDHLSKIRALEAAVGYRGKGRDSDLPPVQIYDANFALRPLEDILKDMKPSERRTYKRLFKENEKERLRTGEEYAKKLAAEAIRAARENGTEGLWKGNLRGLMRNRLRGQYEALGRYRDIGISRTITYNRYTGLGERSNRGYLSYPPNGLNLDAASVTIFSWPVVLCWGQLRTMARLHLHNELLDLHDQGKLPGADITGRAPGTDHPSIQAITQAYGGSYSDFLAEVRLHGSGGVLRGEPANNPDIAKRAAKERMDDIEQHMIITDSIRQMAGKRFVRHLVDVGKLSPSPIHGHPELSG